MIKPSIKFKGNAVKAIDYYESVFGGTGKLVMRYSDMPMQTPPELKDWVGHAELTFCGTTFTFCDDINCDGSGNQISFMVIFETIEKIQEIFNTLKDGGKVIQDLAPQFYAKMYGCVKDKFGIEWHVITAE